MKTDGVRDNPLLDVLGAGRPGGCLEPNSQEGSKGKGQTDRRKSEALIDSARLAQPLDNASNKYIFFFFASGNKLKRRCAAFPSQDERVTSPHPFLLPDLPTLEYMDPKDPSQCRASFHGLKLSQTTTGKGGILNYLGDEAWAKWPFVQTKLWWHRLYPENQPKE